MENIKSFSQTSKQRFQKNQKMIYLSTIGIIVLGIIGFSTFKITKYNQRVNAIPKVMGANFDENYKKIPYNVKNIDFTISTKLDPASVNKSNFKIVPEVVGEISLISGNTIRYNLAQNLELDKDYYITISKSIKGENGKFLDKDYQYLVHTIGQVKANKVYPEGEIDNLNQGISVFFNIPLVSLTNLKKRDTQPCPIQITPTIDGKCKWTTTSVLEYIPTTHLQGATKYSIKISDQPGLFFPLGTGYESSFQTTGLSGWTQEYFDPQKGIELTYNFPVKIEELQAKTQLFEVLSGKEEKLDIDITNVQGSEQNFIIKSKNKNLIYSKQYKLIVDSGINPKYGNIPLNNKLTKLVKGYDFLSNVTIYKKNFSTTGLELQKEYVDIESKYKNLDSFKYLPLNTEFNLDFVQEVELNKDLISISQDGQNIDYNVSYPKQTVETIENGVTSSKQQDDKTGLIITFNKPFENNKKIIIKINKSVNNSLEKDIIKEYTTAPKMEIKEFKYVGYNKSCIYFNNPISTNDRLQYLGVKNKDYKKIITIPNSRIASFDNEITRQTEFIDQINDIRNDVDWSMLSQDQQIKMDKLFADNKACPMFAHKDAYAYALNTRLNPFTKYSIQINGDLEDIYGNKLNQTITKNVETQSLSDKDQYLYSSLNKDLNVIPSEIPLTINLQSMNVEKAFIQICEMNEEEYKVYIENVFLNYSTNFKPKCIKETNKQVTLQNKYWTLSNNRFDVEKDLLGSKFVGKYVLVRGSVNNNFNPTILNETKNTNNTGTDYYSKFRKNSSVNKEFSNLYLRTNLFLGLEKAKNKNVLLVTDLQGKNSIDKLSFIAYKNENNTLKQVKINPIYNPASGTYEFADNDYSLIFANKEGYHGSLFLDMDSLANYDYGYIAGNGSAEKDYLYLYTERPLYKPGDTLYFKGLLRKFSFDGFHKSDKTKGILRVMNEEGTELTKLDITLDKNSNFNGQFNIPADAPIGNFYFEFDVNGEQISNNAGFSIEEYVKPVFKIDTITDSKEKSVGEKLSINVEPKYYFGGRVTNTNGNMSVLSQNYYFDAKDYSDYQFGDGYEYFNCLYWDSCTYNDELLSYTGFKIDTEGKYKYEIDLKGKGLSGEQILTYNFEITDPNTQKTVSQDLSIILHKTDGYVGLQNQYWNSQKDGIKINGVLLDINANPKKGNVKLELYKLDWLSVKKQDVDGIFYNDYTEKETLIKQEEIFVNEKGLFEHVFKVDTDGEYKIIAKYEGSNKNTFESSNRSYVAGDGIVNWNNGNNDITNLVSDKQLLKVGDTQEFVLQSPVNKGKALILIVKDDGILDYKVHNITSYGDKISIPVKDTYYPNFYTKALLIGQNENNPLPVYKRALSVTKVSTEYKKMNISITTDKQNYSPRDIINIQIKTTDQDGKPIPFANGSIGIVDESLLALKGNPKQNPFAYFYDMKRYIGTLSYSSLKNIIEKLEIKDMSHGEKGGDGDNLKGGNSNKKRGIFKDTSFWLADFETDKDGIANIQTTQLPDNLTTWVIEVLASTPLDNKIGVNRATVSTNKKIMINENLPRFFRAKDEITISPVIFNKTGKDQNVEITIQSTNSIINDNVERVFLKNNEEKKVDFKLSINEIGINENKNLYNSQINIKAVASETKDEDQVERFIPIKENSTPESISTIGSTDLSSFDEKFEVGDIKNNAGKITINYAASLLGSIFDAVGYLTNYPYGCIEQKTSAILPYVYQKKLYSGANMQYDLNTIMIKGWNEQTNEYEEKSVSQLINGYLMILSDFQLANGGFVYWKEETQNESAKADFELSSYIVESMGELKSIGFNIDKSITSKAISYLKSNIYNNNVNSWGVNGYTNSQELKLNAINAILTLEPNDYEGYKMWKGMNLTGTNVSTKILEAKVLSKIININTLTPQEKEILQKRITDLINKIISEELVFNPKGAYIGKSQTYSRLYNTTNLIYIISKTGIDKFKDISPIIENMIRWTLLQKSNSSFGSTQDNINVLKAISAYLNSTQELKDIDYTAKLSLNGQFIDEKQINKTNVLDVFSKTLQIKDLQDTNSFNISKNGKGKIFYDISLNYYVPSKNIESRDEGIFIEKQYFDYEEYSKIKTLKEEEYQKYLSGFIKYDDLKYNNSIYSYLSPIKSGKVGQLIIAYNKIITSETRDKIAFEGYIPSGSELVNVNLKTESLKGKELQNDQDWLFSRKEFRNDRFFGYTNSLDIGIYEYSYMLRLTHKGIFSINPSMIYEFYNPEVFGRSAGDEFIITER